MAETKETTKTQEANIEETNNDEKILHTDWALEASYELQDYIEEQGIYIRY